MYKYCYLKSSSIISQINEDSYLLFIMKKETSIKLFESKRIRSQWNDQEENGVSLL